MHENSTMISSDKVNGTAVYSRSGEHVGTIDHLTIDKATGKVLCSPTLDRRKLGFLGYFHDDGLVTPSG